MVNVAAQALGFFRVFPYLWTLNFSEYRPISLIGAIHKILVKVLTARLKSIIAKIIGEPQSAYVEGCNILDGPLIINEVCLRAKSVNKKNTIVQGGFR